MSSRLLVGSLLVVLTAATPAWAAAPSLGQIALRPAQVGPGYRMSVIPDGAKVHGEVTLDLCGFSFPSEGLRTARLQLRYGKAGQLLQVSNEVVRYRHGGAQQALREITRAASRCPRGPVGSSVAGVKQITYRLARLTDRRLLPGYLALRVHYEAVGAVRGQTLKGTAIIVYQARGDVLSGVYTAGTGLAAQLRVGLHAAEQSALNLERLA